MQPANCNSIWINNSPNNQTIMNKFIPDQGTLFYARVRPWTTHSEDFNGEVTTKVHVDRSYSDSIFQCLGRDSTMVVSRRIVGGYSNSEPYLFAIEDYNFSPVGPEVVAALNLNLQQDV